MLTELGALIDLLKSKGVTQYKGDVVVMVSGKPHATPVELSLTPASPEPSDAKSAPVKEPDLCACGHGLHEHQNGLCLHACDSEKCTKETS